MRRRLQKARRRGPAPLPARERRRRLLERHRRRSAANRSRMISPAYLRQLELAEVGAFASVVFARFEAAPLAPRGLVVLCNSEQLGTARPGRGAA